MERRPIASRETRWAEAASARLAKTGLTPNAISVIGLVAAILAGLCFYLTNRQELPPFLFWIAGAALVQVRLLANLFDGMVAQIQKSSSPLGELYNEIPDRISDVAILVGFGYAVGSCPTLGWSCATLAVIIAYLRAQMAVSGVPQLFVGPMAKSQRMATVTVAALLTATLPAWKIPQIALGVIAGGGIITAIRRLYQGAKHLQSNPSSADPDESRND